MKPETQALMSKIDMQVRNAGLHCGVDHAPFITTYCPVAGYKAVMYWWNPEGFWEPWDTSKTAFATRLEAEIYAKAWAAEEGLEFTPETIATPQAHVH